MNSYTGMRGGFLPVVGLLAVIVTLFTNLATFILRHPLVVKMLLFTIFLALVHSGINFMADLVTPYIGTNSIIQMAAMFGVMQAISLYITIVLAGFGVKQVIAFLRST